MCMSHLHCTLSGMETILQTYYNWHWQKSSWQLKATVASPDLANSYQVSTVSDIFIAALPMFPHSHHNCNRIYGLKHVDE